MTTSIPTLSSKISLPPLKALSGPLTSDLVLTPGDFGLGMIPERLEAESTATSICGFCATGCSLKLHLQDHQAVNLSPDPSYPVNLGMACPKGWEALAPLAAPDRLHTPMLRLEDGTLHPISWEEASSTFVRRMKEVQQRHGKDSVAFLSTGQIPIEEMAFLGAFAKFGMGLLHGDGNTRQCMATAVVAYKQSFGFDSPPYTYRDFEESDVLFLIGSNLCITHPILWQRICMNQRHPKIIVLDPRRTETAMAATHHFPLQPKSDLPLLYAIARELIHRGQIDLAYIARHTQGFEDFRKHVENFTPERIGPVCGLGAEGIRELANLIQPGKRISFWWTMGVNQSHEGTRTAQAIINLALMTGNIGKPGTGANSITGQCNAMGSRLFSNTTGLLGGHDFTNPAHRQKVATALGIPETVIPQQESWAYDQIVEGIRSEKIKALWIIATNSSHSWIHQSDFNRVLKKLEFLVVQDLYSTTETALHADLLLAAAGWGEKEGTFINSERRIGVIRKVRKAPGQALADFSIFRLLANAWGCDNLFHRWTSPEAVFQQLKQITAGQPCDITGIRDYGMIEEAGGIQWPYPAETPANACERRLFENGIYFHPDQKARFLFASVTPAPENPDEDYPFRLLTGRGSSAQWHTQTRSGKSAVLRQLHPTSLLAEINPADARYLKIETGNRIKIQSRRASIEATAFITPTVQKGQIFLPMHDHSTNLLTHPSFDPHSRQPSFKGSAVQVERSR